MNSQAAIDMQESLKDSKTNENQEILKEQPVEEAENLGREEKKQVALAAIEEEDDENQVGENWTQEVSSFDDMCLKDELLRGIYAYGFKEPSNIQQKAVMPITQGRDTIAQAQSGTGKTGAFSIGLLQTIDVASAHTQAIVVSPTRELSM